MKVNKNSMEIRTKDKIISPEIPRENLVQFGLNIKIFFHKFPGVREIASRENLV